MGVVSPWLTDPAFVTLAAKLVRDGRDAQLDLGDARLLGCAGVPELLESIVGWQL